MQPVVASLVNQQALRASWRETALKIAGMAHINRQHFALIERLHLTLRGVTDHHSAGTEHLQRRFNFSLCQVVKIAAIPGQARPSRVESRKSSASAPDLTLASGLLSALGYQAVR